MECRCQNCQSACRRRPGWFAPGEVAKAASLLNMSEQEFFDKHVGVDYYAPDGTNKEAVFVLAPITQGNHAGAL